MKYQPSLDGVRALAVIAVVMGHTHVINGGGRGVDVFFVLSGFLITSILLKQPPLADFYLRRARRLLPALFVFILAYVCVGPFLLPHDDHPREALWALSYAQNWSMVFHYRESGLAHTWSLSIEEQFYLLWPFVLLALRKSSVPLLWLGAMWFAFTLLRDTFPNPIAGYYVTALHATGLIAGAALAFGRLPSRFGWPALLAILLCFALGGSRRGVWDIPLIEISTAFLISALLKPSALTSAFAWKPVAWVGLISYGVYLWHWPIAYATRDYWWSLPVTLAGSLSLAALSYYLIELPFRRSAKSRTTIAQLQS